MAFVVTVGPDASGESSVRIQKPTPKDAMETAAGLLAQGFQRVTITDNTGRIFSPSEFAENYAERG
jgi:hypothetical protein